MAGFFIYLMPDVCTIMGRGKTKSYTLENIEVVAAGAEGKCISREEGKVIFSEKTVPGDVVNLLIKKTHKSYAEGTLLNVVSPSLDRVPTFCEHATYCGGCKWQQMGYPAQLKWKNQQVMDAIQRIGGILPTEAEPIMGAQITESYRNKTEFSFTAKAWVQHFDRHNPEQKDLLALGFHIPGLFDKVFQVNYCHLMPSKGNEIRNYIQKEAIGLGISFRDIKGAFGNLQTLMIRSNRAGEFMVVLMFAEMPDDACMQLMEKLKQQFNEIVSLQYAYNPKRNDSWEFLDIKVFHGADHLIEKLGSFQFRIQARSFFQTNPYQAEHLYHKVKEYAGLTGNEVLYDLYSGTGTIGLFLSDKAKKVVGLEYVEDAVADALINAQLNQIGHADFMAGDMAEIFNEALFERFGKPDVIITDPPRSGMHEKVVYALKKSKADRIVYVSCNPATLARDLSILCEDYELAKICPVDMFPHTHHVECVCLLIRKK